MIRYTCKFTFSDPFDDIFDHTEYVTKELPESTYQVVKAYMFEHIAKLNLDIPNEYSKVTFEIIKEERL